MTPSSISVLIAEDDPLLRNFVTEILSQQEDLKIVGAVGSGRDTLSAVRESRPDVLLLDLHLPELSGLKVLERLSETEGAPRVLVLSGDEDETTMLQVARAGARGFLCKSSARTVLPKAIRTVAQGEVWFSQQLLGRILSEYPTLVRQARRSDRPLDQLTEKEREVLVRIARGLTNQQIARELYISVSSVKVHIRGILRKLEIQSRTEAAVFAVREGLLEQEAA